MLCDKCGRENEETAKYCAFCGASLRCPKSDVDKKIFSKDDSNKNKRISRNRRMISTAMIITGVTVISLIVVFAIYGSNGFKGHSETVGENSTYKADMFSVEEGNALVQKEVMQKELCDMLKQTYGTASGEAFVTSEMGKLKDWPASVSGYINHMMLDLDNNGEEELIAIYIEQETQNLYVELYEFTNMQYECIQKCQIGYLDAFSQFTLYLYKNESLGKYQMFYTNNSVGSYTGYIGFTSRLFTIDQKIEETAVWEWTDAVNTLEEANSIRVGMRQWEITYLEAGKLSFGQFDRNKQMLLAKSNVNVYGEQPAMYTVEMQILNYDRLQQ